MSPPRVSLASREHCIGGITWETIPTTRASKVGQCFINFQVSSMEADKYANSCVVVQDDGDVCWVGFLFLRNKNKDGGYHSIVSVCMHVVCDVSLTRTLR